MALNPGDLYFENMLNDTIRILEGGLWHNNVPVGNQGHGTDGRYTTDLKLVQAGLTAHVAANDFAGVQLTHVNIVLADIPTALAVASPPVSSAPAAPVAIADTSATPIYMHHSSFAEMAHHFYHIWR